MRLYVLDNGTLEPDRIDRRIYPSFGECIYCGAKAGDVKLTDEHVMPFALGGNVVITGPIRRSDNSEVAALTRGDSRFRPTTRF